MKFVIYLFFHMNNKKTISLWCESLHVVIDILYAWMNFHILYMWNVYYMCVMLIHEWLSKCTTIELFFICVFSCDVWARLCVNDFPHVAQVKGLSSVCIFLCTLWSLERTNDFPHRSHVNGFLPVWVISCCLKDFLQVYDFPHVEQVKGLSLVCDFSCTLRVFEHMNDFPQE